MERIEVLEERVNQKVSRDQEDEIDRALREIEEENKQRQKRAAKRKKVNRSTRTEPVSLETLQQMKEAFVQDENLRNILIQHQKDVEKRKLEKNALLKKKLQAKIRAGSANRAPERWDNVKYDERGKKVGRLQV